MAQSTTPDPAEKPDNPAPDARPEGLPDNFKNVEALASSYQELQRRLTEEAQTRSSIEQNYNELAQQFSEITSQPQTPSNDARAQVEQMWENDPLGTVAYLVQEGVQQGLKQTKKESEDLVNPALETQYQIVAAYADNAMTQAHEDWQDYGGKVADAIKAQPWLLPDRALASPQLATQALENVYKMVKADDILAGTVQTKDQSEADRQRKLQAQTASGAGGRPQTADEQQAEWDRIKGAAPQTYWQRAAT